MLGGPDGTFADKFATARSELSTQAGFDIVTTIPADPVAPDAAASTASRQYALLLGGIANLVNNVAIQSGAAAPTYDMVVAVTFIPSRRSVDGQYFGDTNVPGSGATPVSLPQNLDFNAEVNRFRNNNASVYEGVTLPTVEVTSFLNTAPTSLAADQLVFGRALQLSLTALEQLMLKVGCSMVGRKLPVRQSLLVALL